MRRLLAQLSTITLIFTLTTLAALLIGRAQPTPPRVAMLHLTDCELPCWIGIVPGKTTLFEAWSRLNQVYGAFQITQIYELGSFFLSVEMPRPNQKPLLLFDVYFLERRARSRPLVIERISLANFSGVSYGDFVSLAGSPTDLFPSLPNSADNYMPAMFYKPGKIQAGFGTYIDSYPRYSTCGGVFPTQAFTAIDLYGTEQNAYTAWLGSPPLPWRGFRTCYQ